MSKKATKIETINAIIEKYGVAGEDKEFLEHEVQLIAKRNSYKSSKPTKKQVANDALSNTLVDLMEEKVCYTATDLAGMLGVDAEGKPYSVQRVSALLTKLKKSGVIATGTIKRRTYFGLPGAEFDGVKLAVEDAE